MTAFRNFAGCPFRNGQSVMQNPEQKLARVTGLEPATSGVTGRAFVEQNQRALRKAQSRNDSSGAERAETGFGMRAPAILSLFPGMGLLDMAFEEEGHCVVRGPDLLWGGNVKRFHPPPVLFDGYIGGPPCKRFTRLRHIIEANGFELAEDLIPEFSRCIDEGQPRWFLMENVPAAPLPAPELYYVMAHEIVQDVWCGGETSRERRFTFGCSIKSRVDAWRHALHREMRAIHRADPEFAVTCDARERPVALMSGMRPKKPRESGGKSSSLNRGGGSMTVEKMAERQGLPAEFVTTMREHGAFTDKALRTGIGNGVPLAMGRAVARAVTVAMRDLEDAP